MAERPAPAPRLLDRTAAAVTAAPDRVVLVTFWTTLVVSSTALVDAFTPAVVLPLLAVVLVATWRLVPHRLAHARHDLLGALLALAAAAAWLVVQLPHASRYVLVTRDPGFLTLQALWFTGHRTSEIPARSAIDVAARLDGVHATTGAYIALDGSLYAQGAKTLPALLALGGWAAGDVAVAAGNLVVGAVALLALYGAARRFVGPLWALLPVVALAASIPLAVFSRAAYTEPLVLALAFGGLTMASSAFTTRTTWRHALAGALVGATSLVRIDGAATVIGLVAGFALVSGAALLPSARRRARSALLAAGGGALVTTALGYLDLRWHSPGYLADLGEQFTLLALALTGTLVVALVLALPRVWDPLRRLVLRRRRGLALVCAAAVVAVALVLWTRQWWGPAHHTAAGTHYAQLVAGLQAREGLEVDETRSYDEWSTRWLAWYYGWPMVVAGFAGLALAVRDAVRRRDPRLVVLVALVGAPTALYLWRVSISPDQVWAMRRLLPLTVPGMLLCGTYALHRLAALRHVAARAAAAVVAAAVAVVPWSTWPPGMFGTAEHDGRLGELRTVCEHLTADRVVYVDVAGPPYLASLVSVCDVDAVRVDHVPDAAELARLREAWGGAPVDLVTFTPEGAPWQRGTAPRPLRETVTTTWGYTLSYVPRHVETHLSQVWVGTVEPDGTVVPAAPAR